MGRYGFPRDNRILVKAVVGLFILEAVMNIIVAINTAVELKALGTPEGVEDWHNEDLTSLDLVMLVGSGVLYFLGVIVLVVFFCIWKNRSCKNSWLLNPTAMTTTPAWAVGWYFIPIANLFKPYLAMREIRNTSCSPGKLSAALPAWWTLWIISNVVDTISMGLVLDFQSIEKYKASAILDTALLPLSLVLSYIIIRIVLTITTEQTERLQQLPAGEIHEAPPSMPGYQQPSH